jgi:hypothetical protein
MPTIAPASLAWNLKGQGLNPPLELPISDFMSESMLFYSICIKDMIGSCRPEFNSQYQQNFSDWDFSRFKYLDRFQLDCFNGKKGFDGYLYHYG